MNHANRVTSKCALPNGGYRGEARGGLLPHPLPPPPFQGRKKVSLRPGIPLSQGLDDRSPLISLLPAVIIGLEGIAIKSYLSIYFADF